VTLRLLVLAAVLNGALSFGSVQAAEIKVLSAGALRPLLQDLAPDFEKSSGSRLTFAFATAGGVEERIASGEAVDVALLTGPRVKKLAGEGKSAKDSIALIGRAKIGLAVKKGAPQVWPDHTGNVLFDVPIGDKKATEAAFATPGGKGGWICTTPMVAVGRNIGRKRALEMLLTGDTIDAHTAADWGLVNRVVPAAKLHEESLRLIQAASGGSTLSKGIGKQAYYAQIDLDQPKAYAYAMEVMASTSQTPDAKENARAFKEKRKPIFNK